MSEKIKVSVILITKDEEKNIVKCLQSLDWADEVIMVDSGSTDNTVALAKNFENVKVILSEWLGFSGTKRVAVQHSAHDWVFWIDADEIVQSSLKEELCHIFPLIPAGVAAYDVPRKTFFMGEWVRHTGWYPGRVTRFFNKHHCDFNDNILHEGIVITHPYQLGHLKEDLLHNSYTSLHQYFDKMNYYGKYGAEELLRKGKKLQGWKIVMSPITAFLKSYIAQRGFLDGKKGLIISIGSAFSHFIKYTNFWYLKKKGRLDGFEVEE